MKIVYLGHHNMTDSDFPLVRALQKKGIDIIYYISIVGDRPNFGVLGLKKIIKKDAILHCREYDEFKAFEKYMNLDNVYIINNYHYRRWHWQSWVLWLKVFLHIKRQNADIFHYVFTLVYQRFLLRWLSIPKVMTVHDPISHSSLDSKKEERARTTTFRSSDKFVLLSDVWLNSFMERYKIPREDIMISKFGRFDWLDFVVTPTPSIPLDIDYILFWGQIQSHKGVDILLEAMLKVHQIYPQLKCIIAGGGKYYFDTQKYKSFDFIEFRNYYLDMPELIGLLRGCLFVVAPYKDATQSGVVQVTFSAQVPMIVSNVGALPVSVLDGITGIVVPPSDVEGLCDAIIRLVSDKKLQEMFRKNITNIWAKDLSWEIISNKYINLYKSLIST